MEKKRVVVAEDDRAVAKLIQFKLLREGLEVEVATDGGRALEIIEGKKPDLILLDVMMPVLGGFQVLRQLKEREDLKDIPVIMLTAKGREEDIVKGIEMGSSDYITKPFRPSELIARLKRFLEK